MTIGPVSDEEFEQLSDRIGGHFDRVREALNESLNLDGGQDRQAGDQNE